MPEAAAAEMGAADMVGRTFGPSRWILVDQAMIDAFAAMTGDPQFIHTDPVRARTEAGLEGTIAHGFLILSLLGGMGREVLPRPAGLRHSLNYGFDRVRFLAPVPAGARVRARFTTIHAEERVPGELSVTNRAEVEIEGGARPALVADWIGRRYFEGDRG